MDLSCAAVEGPCRARWPGLTPGHDEKGCIGFRDDGMVESQEAGGKGPDARVAEAWGIHRLVPRQARDEEARDEARTQARNEATAAGGGGRTG
jgi:hypothetical protein